MPNSLDNSYFGAVSCHETPIFLQGCMKSRLVHGRLWNGTQASVSPEAYSTRGLFHQASIPPAIIRRLGER